MTFLDGTPTVRQRFRTNTVWNLIDTASSFVSGFVASILVARALGPAILGRYQFILWVGGMVAGLSTFGVPAALARYMAMALGRNDEREAGETVRLALSLQLKIIAAISVILAALLMVVPAPEERLVAVIAWTVVPITLLMAIPTSVNAVLESFGRNVISSLLGTAVEITLVLLTIWQGWSLVGLATALTCGRAVDCASRYFIARRELTSYLTASRGESSPALRRDFHRMALEGFSLQALNVVVLNRSEIFFLERFRTAPEIAFFSLALGITKYLGVAPQAILRSLTPIMYKSYATSTRLGADLAVRSIRLQTILSAPFFALAILHADLIVGLLYGGRYASVAEPLIILGLLTIPAMGLGQLEVLVRAADRQRDLVRWTAGMLVVTLLLDWGMIVRYGAVGAALALGLAKLIHVSGVRRIVQRALPDHPVQVPHYRFLFLALGATGLFRLLTPESVPVALLLAVNGTLGMAVYLAALWVTPWLRDDERRLTREAIRYSVDRLGRSGQVAEPRGPK